MTRTVRLGILTPSSNTVLEPLSAAIIRGVPGASVHFSRFPVTEIALSPGALAQFDDAAVLRAAELLAHARVDVIAWSGTSASWLGFEADEALCARIRAATGVRATTSVLALNGALARTGVRRLGLVTPYRGDVQARIVANYAALGVECVAERHLDLQDNFSFAEVAPPQLDAMVREVAAVRPDAVAVVCTNLRGAPLVAGWEAALGLPVYDSVATALWGSLGIAGADASVIQGWGGLFGLPAPA